ncbi:diguanylate cyclase (GGDEF)-like protein [Sphingomonas sp. PP-F2F-G114-C0414]|uniref:GGDEF domain-containing protein n=1 Tax=Sphingomonas sp. PP-F2F-G114-C0414 TaxID=2135662 RepID=UPI000EF89462|nr:GGDEF domain-containing protein [Sphingomonas sp. PP-F2F-G114-C0414]RMB28481.1 diguanylate cyclase (GGDEF)-like protein [Sphingomonas sp. PP-F2F-G114-C0414]
MALDLSTLYVVAGLGMLVAGFIHLIPLATGRFGSWAGLWGAGHLIAGCGALMAVLNDRIGLPWAPSIGNPAVVMGYALIAGAAVKFDRPDARLRSLLAIAAVLGLPLWFTHDPAHFHLRVAYLSVIRAGFDLVVVVVAVRFARRDSLQTGWIVAALFAVTVPMFLGRAWLAYSDRIGTQLTGRHDDLGAWLAAGQIAFIIFRAFSLLILQAERGQNLLLDQMERDWLTGAFNRAGLDRIVRTFAGCHAPRTLTVMMLDLDRFKTLNDTFGHAAGDAALRTFAEIAHEALGRQGHLVRWGGDEFVCVLPDVPTTQARAIGTSIATRFAQTMAPRMATHGTLGVSFGIVEGEPQIPIVDLIADADRAMYRAKSDRRQPAVCIPPVYIPDIYIPDVYVPDVYTKAA